MRIAIATCEDPPVRDLEGEMVISALVDAGVTAEFAVWSDPGADWAAYDGAWLSSTWDYHRRLGDFRGWLSRTGVATRLHNPRVLVDWNVDKRYLRELGGAGVPIVPTVWTMPELAVAAQETVGDLGWEQVVVKPTVDLGAENLARVAPDEVAAAVERCGGAAMAQPYLPAVAAAGELSLVYFRGELSHAVRKVPAEGDFRVQQHYGGRYSLVEPGPEALAIGRRTHDAMAELTSGTGAPLYSRVDLVSDLDERLCVIELELIEPSLYLDVAGAEPTERFARLLAEAAAE